MRNMNPDSLDLCLRRGDGKTELAHLLGRMPAFFPKFPKT
jgi:hypothetical protein